MQRRRLGAGLEVPAMGLGCMGMSGVYGVADEDEAVATIRQAVEEGVGFLDSSDMYGAGHNEGLVGRAIAPVRDRVVLATKFGHVMGPQGRPVGVNGRPEYVRSAFEASLSRLGVDHVDLYYQHRVDPSVPIEDTVGAMAALVEEGRVGFIGLCEASPSTIRRASAVHPLAAVQSEHSLWWRGVEAEVLPTCRELGIGFVAYSPLGRGLLTGSIKSAADISSDDRRSHHPRFQGDNLDRNVVLAERVRELAAEKGCEPAQLALAWLLAQGDDVVPIPGSKTRGHLAQNVAALDVELSAADLERIEDVVPAGSGAGLRYPAEAMKGLEL
ncbi:MAG: aldo/keto reductase [Acidimicrobiales bacterium]